MPVKYQNDEWVLSDDFGLAGAGDALARLALEAQPPFTIAVTGKWGTGKTSVLRRAFATLGGQPVSQALPMGENKREDHGADWDALKFSCPERTPRLDWNEDLKGSAEQSMCIWYSPWQHQSEANPIIPLLMELRQQFTGKDKLKGFARQSALAAITLLKQATDAAISLHAGKPVKFVSGTTEAVRKAWQGGDAKLVQPGDGQRFHLLFEDAVETLLKSLQAAARTTVSELSATARLIIFIDDLDRCEEQAVISLLEAIKLYLGTQRCVFVLGIDDTALLGTLRRVWKERSEDENREYLEKLLQTILPVPLPRQEQVRKIIHEQLKEHGFPEAAACAKTIEALLEPNPRKIKNFTNSLCTCWNLFQLRERTDNHQTDATPFIMFHYLRLYHRSTWRLLERQPAAQRLLFEVLTNNTVTLTEPIDGIDDLEDQRLMIAFMQQAFAHVLKQQDDDANDKTHHGEKLDAAIQRFQRRQDRKRSDEVFVRWFRDNPDNNRPLDPAYLYLPPADAPDTAS